MGRGKRREWEGYNRKRRLGKWDGAAGEGKMGDGGVEVMGENGRGFE